jgi:PAN domain/TIR domain
MAGIFINYRRDDAPGVAGRLFDHLAARFSKDDLFMDVDAMKPGMDFSKQLDTQVSQCRVLLAVIGPHWVDTKERAGAPRLDSDKDYVRIELASALKRDIAVIPVLVDGATMPPEESLSEDLKPLAYRHALELRHSRFSADADAIVHALEAVVPRRRMLWPLIGAGIAAVLVIAAGGVTWQKLKTKPAVAPPAVQMPGVAATTPAPANPPVAPKPAPQPVPAAPPTQATPAPSLTPPPAASATAQAGLPPGIKLDEIMPNVAFRGSLYRIAESADPPACQAACQAEARCVAWTYTAQRPNDTTGHCSLKAVIPQQFIDGCCTSGVVRVPDPELRVPPPIPSGVTGALTGVELEGGSYRYFPDATIEGCQAACRADNQCIAWDYVRPGIFATDARCFLKNKMAMEVQSPCCVAGYERQIGASPTAPATPAPVAASKPVMPNTDLRGSSYRSFELSSADATLCQNTCKAESQCLAWTYVHPGVQGVNARCWLKNLIPPPSANNCCTSGIERAAAQ